MNQAFMAISGRDRNPGPGQNALHFSIDSKGSFIACTADNPKQHTTFPYQLCHLLDWAQACGLNSQTLVCQPRDKPTQQNRGTE